MTDRVIMGANWYVGTINQAKRLDSVTLPRLNKAVDRFVSGGGWMALSVPTEIEELTATFSLKGAHEDVRGLFGYEPGDWTSFFYYERLRDIMAGQNIGRVVTITGLVQEVQQPRVTGKRADMTTYTIGSIVTYKDVLNGVQVHYLDFDTNSLVMNGVDYSSSVNALLAR